MRARCPELTRDIDVWGKPLRVITGDYTPLHSLHQTEKNVAGFI